MSKQISMYKCDVVTVFREGGERYLVSPDGFLPEIYIYLLKYILYFLHLSVLEGKRKRTSLSTDSSFNSHDSSSQLSSSVKSESESDEKHKNRKHKRHAKSKRSKKKRRELKKEVIDVIPQKQW